MTTKDLDDKLLNVFKDCPYKGLNNRFVGAVVDQSNNWRVIEMIILLGGSYEKQL